MNGKTKKYRHHPETPDGYFWATNFDKEFSEIPEYLKQRNIEFKLGTAYNTVGESLSAYAALFIKFDDEHQYDNALQVLFGVDCQDGLKP